MSRPGCNANFIFDADLSFDRALAEARKKFPRIEAAAPITGPHEYDETRKR